MIRRRAAGAILALLVAGTVFAAAPPAKPERELRATRERAERLEGELASAEEGRTEAAEALRDSEKAISEANRSLRELAGREAALRETAKRQSAESRRLSSEIAERRGQLERLLYARYVAGEQGVLRLILSGDDPNRLARQLVYVGYLSRGQQAFIEALEADVRRLAELERESQARLEALARLEAEEKAERARLVAETERRRKTLASLSDQIRTQRRELAVLKRNEARLARLAEDLARRPPPPGDQKVPEAALRGSVSSLDRRVLELPVTGELANRFGTPRKDGGLSWKGVFIRAGEGREVRAVDDGRVVFADWMRGFGNLLIIDHGKGYLSIYGNNESVLKRTGDAVRAGDVVATVGSTGGNEESGLYFEVRHKGEPVDPLPWVTVKK